MITKCHFCSFHKEQSLSEAILNVISDPTLPDEDRALWIDRLIRSASITNYHAVKVHMGRMHKDKTVAYLPPLILLNDNEKAKIGAML